MKKLTLLCATTALFAPSMAFAQTTGTLEAEAEGEIVVTGQRSNDVGGIAVPDTTKPRGVLEAEAIQRARPGQTILDTINLLPGVSFQNNDPYGSAGGTIAIRGFDGSRISLTFDGVPLNDSGNYAIYSNQQVDPELIETVNVSLGTTDVDSPTASAAGGTVSYRTRVPFEEFGGRFSFSIGEYNFRRIFGSVDTGAIGPWGTRMFFAASRSQNDVPFNNFGTIDKQQFNARIYQPIGDNGDFVSIAGHYNQNRNNFLGSVPLRLDASATRVAGTQSFNRFPITGDERFASEVQGYCASDTPQAGVADSPASYAVTGGTITCGSTFDERFNPSNTGNVRLNSRFTLSDSLLFTFDGFYQYVLANGGGTATAREFGFDVNPAGGAANCATTANSATVNCRPGYIGGQPYLGGVDLNGDGDTLDQVLVLAPSNTNTNRVTGTASLIWDINDQHRIRGAYTYDFAEHRQTGEVSTLDAFSFPNDFFGRDNPVRDVNGFALQKRDRLSYAILHQFSAEYRGRFMDGALTLNVGARLPFFTRDLTQNCFTTSAGGFVDCFGGNNAAATDYITLNPTVNTGVPAVAVPRQGPRNVVYEFNEVLPNIGILYDVAPNTSIFANYARGISVPSTDNLYNGLFFATPDIARPEITDSFDIGMRYRSGRVQAQLAGWYTIFTDRTASAFDPELNETVYRNLGTVEKMGVDFSIGYEPVRNLMLYAFASYLESNIQDDIVIGSQLINGNVVTYTAATAGRRESGSPDWLIGGRIQGRVGPVELGLQAKHTGERYVYDTNLPVLTGATGTQIYPATTESYTLVDLDARVSLGDIFPLGSFRDTYLQLNITNVFDQLYVGGFGGGLSQQINRNAAGTITGYGNPPFVQIGAPRTLSVSMVFQF